MEILLRRGQFINKGAEAMLKTASRELSGRLGTVTMTLPPDAIYSGTAPLAEAAGFRLMPAGPQSRAERLSAGRRIACHPFLAGRRMIDPLWREAVTRLQGLAAVVDVAGFAYGDTWPVKHIARTRAYVGAARFLGIPHVFLPQAWGPFELQRRMPIFRQMCTDTTTAYARDRTSFAGLSRLMRNTGSACDIRLAPDIAFRFKGASPQVGRQLLEASGVPSSSEPLVAVVPNWKVYERSRGIGLENRYVQALCDICRDLRRAGTTVVLIPHEISQSELGTVDDRLLCGLVTAGVSDPRVVFMNGRYSAEEIKAVIGNCRMLVGSRFHALVAALSQGIPVGAIGWSHKYHELLKEFGLSEFVTDFESLARSSIRELVHLLLREQDSLADVVGAKLPEIFRQVDAVFDDLAGTIAGNGVRQAAQFRIGAVCSQQKTGIMNIRVVIATHDRTALLARTLASLAECRSPPGFLGVTVVENGGRHGSEAVCSAAAEVLNVQYLYCEQGNKSAALNQVLKQTGDELLVFLDDDVRLERETLCAYAAAAREETGRVFFGGPIEPDYETVPDPWLHLPHSARGWSLAPETRYVDQPCFLGFNWAARANELREMGGFSPLVGPGGTTGARGQESEMQRRMLRDGFLGRYVNEALVRHWVPAVRCSEEWSLQRVRQNAMGAGLLICQRGPIYGTLRWTASRVMEFAVSVLGGHKPPGYAARLQWLRWKGYVEGRILRITQQDVPAEAYGSNPATATLPFPVDTREQGEVAGKPESPARQSA